MDHQPKTERRWVDFTNNPADYGCAIMAMMGLSTKAILRRFPQLSQGQVTYRVNLKGIKRKSYRDGENMIARVIVAGALAREADSVLLENLQKTIKAEVLSIQTQPKKKAA